MNRFTMILALLLMAAIPMMAERVAPETARKVATTFLNNNGVKSNQLVDLSKAAGFQNLYIFNSNPGFVVMSADDCVKPILGYSLTNTFVAEGMPENIRGWLQGYSDEIRYAVDNRISADTETEQLWKDLTEGNSKATTTVIVDALVQTKWDQIQYYNLYCPAVADGPGGRAYTGCVATAMAQIMKYWKYPSHGMGSHSYIWSGQTLSANFGETTYDWSNMKDYYHSYYDDEGNLHNVGNPSSAEIVAVSTLMYHCGVSLNMSYGGYSAGGSSASTSVVVDALKTYFNYSLSMNYKTKSSYSNDTWIALVKAELDSSRPLQYRGSSGGGGHSFICDGYDSSNNFHFNWGWAGWCNGFYSLGDLTTHDPGSGGGNGNYTNDQGAIFGIQPSECTADAPENLAYIQNGRNVTLNWNVASGAASYNIYLDSDLIGNATTNSYATTAPYGTHFYYVRSVDGSGELSLSSNSVSVTVDYQTPIVNDLQVSLWGSNANLNWTAPAWCYPETPSEALYYGTQIPSNTYMAWNTSTVYWGHRHLSENLTDYDGMKLYSVEFHANNAGTYEVCIYEGTSSGTSVTPTTHISTQTIAVTTMGWHSIDLPTPHVIDKTKDLWIFIHNPQPINGLMSFLCTSDGSYGCYYSSNPLSYTYNNITDYAFLIKSYLTDGTYTYNLYQDGTKIVENIGNTTYEASLNDNAANQFVVKTNFYGGEAESNMVGFAKGSTSLTSLELGINDKMTLTENSKLTLNSDVINTNPDNLILEDGAQLIHSSEGVKATVKKSIEPYTANDNGWNFIASPVTENTIPSENNGFLNGTPGQGNNTYDLYYYDEPYQLWRNYESQSFEIENKKGYLYANGETNGTTLQFAGTLSPSNEPIAINNLSHSATTLNGFNLVGNPFACNATVDKDYYIVNGHNLSIPETGHVIAPCEGVFVQASENDASVTFTKVVSAKGTKSMDCIDIVVMQNKTTIDRARVRFGDGEGLEKFNLEGQHTQISFQHNRQDFAVVYTKAQNEMPVNFKASENGTYTISMESKNLDLDYLHLIDNFTGNDVDLLATPSYTFEAKTTDYASRFRLVFSNDENVIDDNDAFAYFNNGNIVVNQEGTLQIVDMTGRVIVSRSGRIQCIPTMGMAPGVYVLRLITADDVKTQKIVVE